MPTFKIVYTYVEGGVGYAYIEAENSEKAKEIFEEGDFDHNDEEMDDCSTTFKKIIQLKD